MGLPISGFYQADGTRCVFLKGPWPRVVDTLISWVSLSCDAVPVVTPHTRWWSTGHSWHTGLRPRMLVSFTPSRHLVRWTHNTSQTHFNMPTKLASWAWIMEYHHLTLLMYVLQTDSKFKRFDGLELPSPDNAWERIWLRYTPSHTGFTINVPGQHQHNESELFANFMKTQTLNMTLKNQFAVWNHWQKVTKKMYCLYWRLHPYAKRITHNLPPAFKKSNIK